MLKFHPLKVKARTEAADDAVCVTFELPAHLRELYRFEAGQHVVVRLPVAGEDVRRSYSIVCPAGSPDLSIGVRVQPGGQASSFLGQRLQVGETLEVLTPNGSFHTRIEPRRAKRYVAFAAGSGITPVLSIAATVLESEPHSHLVLFYGNRTAASTMFLDEVLALKNRYTTRFSVHFLMSREPQDIELFNGRLDGAKVREFARAIFDVAAIDEFFVCGPGSMVEAVSQTLRELGATGRIHTELFATAGNPIEARPATLELASTVAGEATQVTIVMDGRRRSFSMPRANGAFGGDSVLDAAARAGFDLPYSCRAGVCSTCRAKLVKGEVRMEHSLALEDWEVEAGYMLCCQAQPTTAEVEITYDE
ncbi:MAG TPA: 2Fe-2S iron-sulfur cluster-binding protein [Steroidobacteraceae bacterium]|jgi:ring-1,2-phenylacetyl-CoA epoxidase subunit PaaE